MTQIAGVAGGLPALKNPTTLRYTITVINTEETVALPSGTRTYIIKNVGKKFVKVAYDTGDIALGSYYTLAPFEERQVPGTLRGNISTTLYVSSPGLETIELDIWR